MILVNSCASSIGSPRVDALLTCGDKPVVVDNSSTSAFIDCIRNELACSPKYNPASVTVERVQENVAASIPQLLG